MLYKEGSIKEANVTPGSLQVCEEDVKNPFLVLQVEVRRYGQVWKTSFAYSKLHLDIGRIGQDLVISSFEELKNRLSFTGTFKRK